MLACLVCLLLIRPPNSAADPGDAHEYEVKAAFLYNFGKFIEWPPNAFLTEKSPFVICILGEDPFGEMLDPVSHKTVQGRRVRIRPLARTEAAQGCHVLYISHSEFGRMGAILERMRHVPLLTVSDSPQFVRAGGMIGFFLERDRVQFDINLAEANKAGLKISSRLLRIAKKVLE